MRRFGIVFISVLFFTACSSDQAVKNYYRAYFNGNYARAARYVVNSQQESYSIMEQQQTKVDKKSLRNRSVRVKNVQSEHTSDSTAVATCMLVIKKDKQVSDTAYRVVLLKKEGRRWKVNNGLLPIHQ